MEGMKDKPIEKSSASGDGEEVELPDSPLRPRPRRKRLPIQRRGRSILVEIEPIPSKEARNRRTHPRSNAGVTLNAGMRRGWCSRRTGAPPHQRVAGGGPSHEKLGSRRGYLTERRSALTSSRCSSPGRHGSRRRRASPGRREGENKSPASPEGHRRGAESQEIGERAYLSKQRPALTSSGCSSPR